jgi:hypothetical protein
VSTVLNEAQTKTWAVGGSDAVQETEEEEKHGSATIALAARRAYPSHTADSECEKDHLVRPFI